MKVSFLKLIESCSLNNIVSDVSTDNSDPSGSQAETLTYIYNDQNRRTTGQLTIMPNDLFTVVSNRSE